MNLSIELGIPSIIFIPGGRMWTTVDFTPQIQVKRRGVIKYE